MFAIHLAEFFLTVCLPLTNKYAETSASNDDEEISQRVVNYIRHQRNVSAHVDNSGEILCQALKCIYSLPLDVRRFNTHGNSTHFFM